MFGATENNKAKGWYVKNKYFDYFVIDYFDEENDFSVLINFLSEISDCKNIFVNASDIKGIEQKEIINSNIQPGRIKSYRLQLAKIHQESLSKHIFKNRIICFDIYNPNAKIQWKKYLESQTENTKKEIKKDNLYASISLTEETRVEIICKKDIPCIESMVNYMNEIGYSIQRIEGFF